MSKKYSVMLVDQTGGPICVGTFSSELKARCFVAEKVTGHVFQRYRNRFNELVYKVSTHEGEKMVTYVIQ